MKKPTLIGTITALVTPFSRGHVDSDDLRKLVKVQLRAGISGLVPVGTTGESPTLSHEEHLEVISTVVETVAGKVPVIAGTGSNSTREAEALIKRAHEAGADAMLVVAPYYNKPSQAGLLAHFSRVAESTDRPIVLYSIPSRCGIEIEVPTVEALRAKYPHVCYIKEAGGSVDRVDRLKSAMGRDITVLSGDDSLTLPFMSVGAEGVISVASNLLPRQVSKMVALAAAHDFAKAAKFHRKLYPLFKALFVEPSPVPVKVAMLRRGMISCADVRMPLCSLSPEGDAVLTAALDLL
ncbi:MAG: 4-hydroxy-tetrahydrodipicolinate synthase [Candidatus Synoicihabitans palmerolidicus]|nr:4-hydroxy-tetrahydrodipicolinate synthase [Candidatus Synoicihabitans palmerolidicus]